jgi:hypothetical protein
MELPEYSGTGAAAESKPVNFPPDTAKSSKPEQVPVPQASPGPAVRKSAAAPDTSVHDTSGASLLSLKPGSQASLFLIDGSAVSGMVVKVARDTIVINASGALRSIPAAAVSKVSAPPQTPDSASQGGK